MAKKTKKAMRPKVENADPGTGLGCAIEGAIRGNGTPFGFAGGTPVNQADTLFVNLRGYLISNNRVILSQAYVEHGLVQTIIDVPVEDAFRGGVEVKTKQLSPEQLQELLTESEREGDIRVVKSAKKWTRLYGGGGVLVVTDQDPELPLNIDAITESTPLKFRACDMWELFFDNTNEPSLESITDPDTVETFRFYGITTHRSRVMPMVGREAPSWIRPRLRGWGLSEVEHFVNAVTDFLKSKNIAFEVLDEFKLDIFQIKGLTQALFSKDGTEKISRRIQSANMEKNYLHSLVMDAEDKYEQKQLTFSGLAEMKKEFRMDIACAMRMPITKIFGISASGFNSGEDDIENYNAMVEGIRTDSKGEIRTMLELRCKRKYGLVPSDLEVSFKPLRILSAEQEENVKTQKFNRVLAAKQANLIDDKEFRDAVNKDQLLPVQLDANKEILPDPNDVDAEDEPEVKPKPNAPRAKVKAKDAPEAE